MSTYVHRGYKLLGWYPRCTTPKSKALKPYNLFLIFVLKALTTQLLSWYVLHVALFLKSVNMSFNSERREWILRNWRSAR